MILISSNEDKLKEFQRVLGNSITIEKGRDLKEVNGTIDEVIIYKALEAGKDRIVEDTILIVNGKEVVDIRWKIGELKEGDKAIWITSLEYNDGEYIRIYRGEIDGTITDFSTVKGWGFDSYFIPNGTNLTLAELNKLGLKDKYSARYIALINLKNDKYEFKIKIDKIPKWKGGYQHT